MSSEVVEYGASGSAMVTQPQSSVSLFRTDDPQEIVARATAVANALSKVIADRQLYSDIQGRRHVRVEGWTLCGSMLGVFPVLVWSKQLLMDGQPQGWEARVEARTIGGATVGAAEAQCTRSESAWSLTPKSRDGRLLQPRDDFALRSMAQTRATAKALRLPLGFIVALAGYEATPAEEMDGLEPEPRPSRRAPEKPQARPGKRQAPQAAGDWLDERVGFGSKATNLGALGEVVPKDLTWRELVDGAHRDGRRYGWIVSGLDWAKEQENPGQVVRLFMERAPLAIAAIEKADAAA